MAGWISDRCVISLRSGSFDPILFRFSKHKAVFLTGLVLTGLGYFSLQFVPEISPDLQSSLDCSSPWSILKVIRLT